MAVALEIGVCDLLTEFFTNALILLGALQAAGAIATGTLQAILDHLHDFFIFVKLNCHKTIAPFSFYYTWDVKGTSPLHFTLVCLSSFLFGDLML